MCTYKARPKRRSYIINQRRGRAKGTWFWFHRCYTSLYKQFFLKPIESVTGKLIGLIIYILVIVKKKAEYTLNSF